MPVNDVLEFASVCYGQSQNQINVTHWKITQVNGVEPTMNEKAGSFSSQWAAVIKPMIANTVTYKGVKVRMVEPTMTAGIIAVTGAGVGALAGDDLPPQIAGVISLRAASAPPRVRGRMYLPQATEGSNDTLGVPTAGYIALLGAMGVFMTLPLTLTGAAGSVVVVPVIWRRAPVHATYQLTQAIVRTTWGTQRRRSAINRADVPAI